MRLTCCSRLLQLLGHRRRGTDVPAFMCMGSGGGASGLHVRFDGVNACLGARNRGVGNRLQATSERHGPRMGA
jgi:hypothetical protein